MAKHKKQGYTWEGSSWFLVPLVNQARKAAIYTCFMFVLLLQEIENLSKGNHICPSNSYRTQWLLNSPYSRLFVFSYVTQLLSAMAWQIAVQVAKRYFPQILLPVTITVGFIGYSIETYIRPPQPAEKSKSVSEIREERRLRRLDSDQEKARWKLFCMFYVYLQLNFDLSGSILYQILYGSQLIFITNPSYTHFWNTC